MWAKLDLQLGPADGRRPGAPEAEGRVGAELRNHRAQPHLPRQHPPSRRKGPSARAQDVRRRQGWLDRQKEPVLELPARQEAQEEDPEQSRSDYSSEPEGQEILVTSKAVESISNMSEVGTSNSDTDMEFIPQLDGPDDVKLTESLTEKKTLEDKTLCPICPENSGYCHCGTCDECLYFATKKGFNIHMMNDHEPNEVFPYFGMIWIKDNFQHIHRNFTYAQDRYHFKKWESFIDEKSSETRV